MISPKTIPVHPFWKFSIKIYKDPVIEESLLRLQNERGLNVNVLLFCCWYSLGDQGRLSKNEIKDILTRIQPWHERIVMPLRRIRNRLKKELTSPWKEIRGEVLKQELFSEQVEQLIFLESFVLKTRPIKNNFQRIVDICKNIFSYCSLLQIFLDTHDCELISKVMAPLFPKIDQENIMRYCMDHLLIKELKSMNLGAQLPLDLY